MEPQQTAAPAPDIPAERLRCASDFWHFARRYARVEHYATNQPVAFRPTPAQVDLISALLRREWVIVGKVRRVRASSAVLIYLTWLLAFHAGHRALVISRRDEEAKALLRWFRRLISLWPEWLQPRFVAANDHRLETDRGSWIVSEVGSAGTGRMHGLDFFLADEAAFIDDLEPAMAAVASALSTSRGVSCVVSTGVPGTHYERMCRYALGGNGEYRPLFFGWQSRPDMTPERYASGLVGAIDKVSFRREHPATWDEMFDVAGGRVYPHFQRDSHVMHLDRPHWAQCYRALDFGSRVGHPFVCLWLWHDEAAAPGLTFEPPGERSQYQHVSPSIDMPVGLEQMFAYRRDDKGRPIKLHDDLPDALRYAVMTWRWTGHVHVYRVLFVHGSEAHPYSMQFCFREVIQLSGWESVSIHGRPQWRPSSMLERYAGTVGDRAGTAWIDAASSMGDELGVDLTITPYVPYESIGALGMVEQGIEAVSALIQGSGDWQFRRLDESQERRRLDRVRQGKALPRNIDELILLDDYEGERVNEAWPGVVEGARVIR